MNTLDKDDFWKCPEERPRGITLESLEPVSEEVISEAGGVKLVAKTFRAKIPEIAQLMLLKGNLGRAKPKKK